MSGSSSDRRDSFGIIAISLPGLPDPSVPIAASRADALGVLDLEFAAARAQAIDALTTLARLSRAASGIRLAGADLALAREILGDLPASIRTIVVDVPMLQALGADLDAVRAADRRLFVEVLDVADAAIAESAHADALIARGLEAGGFVGDVTTFILLQQLLMRTQVPIWAHGGIGLHSGAACRAAGAAGVVLDLQLALVREAALPATTQTVLRRLDGSETVCLGEDLGQPFRALAQPRQQAVEDLRRVAAQLQDDRRPIETRQGDWRAAIRARVGWGENDLWPTGQDAAFADGLARRFVTTGGVIAGVRESVGDHLRIVAHRQPLAEGAPLAVSHGTRYPILQGPMTRVSDTAAFAESVAAGGALPFLALALLRGPEVRTLLEETQRRLGSRPWGVGILGFVPLELRQEQLEVIRDIRPPFALIAGGRPDQAMLLEQVGIQTYLHVPSPALLRMFVEAGARRFVFEGRECGGHVGPRSSFVLWNTMIDALLEAAPSPEIAEACHVIFAGGIHDATSSAMVAALAAPLVERGFKIGVLLGTGYLFTEEAVRSGAVTQTFQDEAVACARTALLETGPGHATRCVATAFVDAFQRERQRLRSEGRSPEEIRDALEELNLGRLRIASKGIARNPRAAEDGVRFVPVPAEVQRREGLYMIGQVAMLRDRVVTIADLHDDVAAGGAARLAALAPSWDRIEVAPAPRPADVAIIGMSCMMPKAADLEAYWSNIVNKVDAITEIPADRFDWRQYYDPDVRARDKIHSKWGGFLDPVPFDPARYGMPPSSLSSIEPLQLLVLEAVRQALDDAGYARRPFPRERTGIVAGVGGGVAELGQRYGFRSSLPMFFSHVPDAVLDALPEWTEDSFAGIINNVAAGRVANRFDFGGVNHTVDAACASSLAALYAAVRELETGTADMMVAAGADTVQSPFGYLCFSKTRALSPRGRSRPFDASADGIAIAEGVAVVVLKRLADAERDGDRIYAVIKSVAGSSDGRDRSLTAPRPEGQMLALRRAYAAAGFSPSTVGLIEAHGTGTVAGDQAEISALSRTFGAASQARQWCAVGSVKSMIGHTKCAAGLAGLIKIAKSVYHKVLPPTLGVEQPNPSARFDESPFYVNSETRPWLATGDRPRRAGVSSFGFGGTNFHAVIEEYTGAVPSLAPPSALPTWPAEIVLFCGQSPDALRLTVDALAAKLGELTELPLRRIAAAAWASARAARATLGREALTLAVVATSADDLAAKLALARARLAEGVAAIDDPRGIYFSAAPLAREGTVAFLFPGQGSQSPDMLRDVAIAFDEVRRCFEVASRQLADRFPRPLGTYVFPPPRFSAEETRACEDALKQTHVAQPSLGAADLAMFRLLEALGVTPDAAVGHSYGEYVALCAAGAVTEEMLYDLSEARGRAIVDSAGPELGTMAAVQADHVAVEAALEGCAEVWIANINAPRQTVVSGSRRGVDAAVKRLEEKGLRARAVAVACAFHSPIIADAGRRFAEHLARARFSAPRIPVFSNVHATAYAADPDGIARVLAEHLVRPVRFMDALEAMYASGCRVFVEVGPRNILTALAQQTFEGRRVLAVPTDVPGRSGLQQLMHALGQLAAAGVRVDLERLFVGRGEDDGRSSDARALGPTTWLVSGGRARPLNERAGATPRGLSAPVAAPPSVVVEAPSPAAASVAARQEPAPVAAPALPSPTPPAWAAGAPLAADPATSDVMVEFQRLMSRFLDTERSVMLAFLGAQGGGTDDVASAGAPTTADRRRHPRVRAPLPVRVRDEASAEQVGVAVDLSPSGLKVRVASPFPIGARVSVQLAPPDGAEALNLIALLVRGDAEGQALCFMNVAPSDLERLTRLTSSGTIIEAAPVAVEPSAATATAASVTPPAAAPTAIDRERLQAEIVRVVSDRTGYPADLLDLDASMEADLGIDSIKRVEIMGALQHALPAALSARVQSSLEELTRAKTLREVIAGVERLASVTESPAPAAPADAVTAPEPTVGAEWLSAQLISVVSDRTGYPPDLLAPDANLEADLGIDSIKRVEILGALQHALPAALGARMQGALEDLTRAKTLRDIVASLARVLSSPAPTPAAAAPAMPEPAAPAPPPSEEPVATGGSTAPTAPRFRLDVVDMPLNGAPMATLPSGPILVVMDDRGIGEGVARDLASRGATIVPVVRGEGFAALAGGRFQLDLANPAQVRRLAETVRQQHGTIGGLLHLGALAESVDFDTLDVAAFRARLRRDVKGLFHLAQITGADLRKTPNAFVVAVTGMDGAFGCRESGPLPFPRYGGVAGLVKTLAVEWPGTRCKVVDVDLDDAADRIAAAVLTEITREDGEVEIGHVGARRVALRLLSAPHDDCRLGAVPLDEHSVLLVTGGARGITAEVAEELAQRYRPTLILVGRMPEPEEHEAPSTAHREDPRELRAALLAVARERGDTPSPAQIERAYRQLVRDREVRRRLATMRSTGATVVYHALDVTDSKRFRDLIEDIYRVHGRIDGVLHGAGVIEDKLLEDKTPESFDRVFDTKTVSAFVLARTLRPESLRFLVFFSSIAGRFGNRGQADYVAANDVMNKLARRLDRMWPGRVVAVNWSPWSGSGMVAEGVARQFAERGLTLVDPSDGRRMLDAEIRCGVKGAPEIVLGAGPWQAARTPTTHGDVPLVTSLTVGAGGRVEWADTLDVARHRYLDDHRIDGTPVLPAAMAVELMAEVVQKAWPERDVVGLRGFRLFRGVVLTNGAKPIRVHAQGQTSAPDDHGELAVDVEILEAASGPPAYRGTVIMGTRRPAPLRDPADARGPLPASPRTAAEAYRDHLFHGPTFQCITELVGIGPGGVVARLRPSVPAAALTTPHAGHWLIDPILLDGGLQLALVWAREMRDMTALPSRIDAITRFDDCGRNGEPLTCHFDIVPGTGDHTIVANIRFVTADQRVVLAVDRFESTCSTALNRLAAQGSR
jgi:acyl transferase domain-containing protein/NAD(P)H-dependent flavin oxidoreductase YrpB (nitropropane dioxygenase family)/NADP-dependent 3-hydroxy acid dehydrogenase YdfG/acyl carrier protein